MLQTIATLGTILHLVWSWSATTNLWSSETITRLHLSTAATGFDGSLTSQWCLSSMKTYEQYFWYLSANCL